MRALALMILPLAIVGCTTERSRQLSMTVSGAAFAPPAFYKFCDEQPKLCDSTSGGTSLTFDAARMNELRVVNRQVNRSIRQVNDRIKDGDRWAIAITQGDCEDIAIRKKKELMRRGWPASMLLLTVARLPFSGQGHTVLTVRTTECDFILDSLNSEVKLWSDTRYDYFARQSQHANGDWVRIR